MRDFAVHWRRSDRDFIVRRKRGRIIAVTDDLEAAWAVAEDAQRIVNDARAVAEAKRQAEKREKNAQRQRKPSALLLW